MDSDLAENFRLVAMDDRGHGLSDKPKDAYGNSDLWADDVQGIISELSLDQPVLCGWSYGELIIADYLAKYGTEHIAGVNLVGAISKLGDRGRDGCYRRGFHLARFWVRSDRR